MKESIPWVKVEVESKVMEEVKEIGHVCQIAKLEIKAFKLLAVKYRENHLLEIESQNSLYQCKGFVKHLFHAAH